MEDKEDLIEVEAIPIDVSDISVHGDISRGYSVHI